MGRTSLRMKYAKIGGVRGLCLARKNLQVGLSRYDRIQMSELHCKRGSEI